MQLITTEKVNNKKLSILMDVLLALMLGAACFFMFTSMFGLKWPDGSIFSGSISGGLAGVWDKIADRLGSLDYVILPKYKASTTSGGKLVYGAALTMIFIAFTAISYFIIKSRTKLLMLLFVVPIAIMMLGYGVTPSVYAGGFFAAAVIVTLAIMRIDGEVDPKYLMVPIAILLAALCVLTVADKTITLREPKELAAFGTSVKEAIDTLRYGSDPLPYGDLGSISGKDLTAARGDIESVKETLGQDTSSVFDTDSLFGTDDSSYDTEESTENSAKDNKAGSKTALTVKMTTPESYYLRGFIGASYNKNKWSTLPNETFYGMRDTIFWLNRRNFDGLSQMSRAAELGETDSFGSSLGSYGESTDSGFTFSDDEGDDEEDEDYDEEDEDDEDDSEYDEDEDDEDSEEEDDDPFSTVGFVDSVYAAGEEDDAYNSISIKVKGASRRIAFVPYEMILKAASGNKVRKSEMKLPEGTKNYGGSHLGTEGIGGRSSYTYKAAENITGSWTDAVGKLYTASSSDDIESYFISESHYNVMQYDNYLDIPDKVKQLINSEIGSAGDLSEDHADYKETIDKISNYLSGSYIYSETFTKTSSKEDFVEKFVQSKSGCDMHFATLATLMFRYFGIPARYVEGYLVTPSMVDGMEGSSEIDVTKRSSHAWTEIYIDGFGWVPFEATPEYEGIMQEANMEVGLQNVDYESTPPEHDDSEEDEYDDDNADEDGKIGRKLLKLFLILIILLVVILLLYIAFKFGKVLMEENRWKKEFADKDPKKGIKALYQYALNHGWELSDEAQAMGLAASYSTVQMQESDRKAMQAEFDKAKEKANRDKAAAKEQAKRERAQEKAAEKQAKEAARQERAEAKAAAKQEKEAAKKAMAENKVRAEQEKSEALKEVINDMPAELEEGPVVGKHDAEPPADTVKKTDITDKNPEI